MIKYISVTVTVLIFVLTGAIGYGQLRQRSEYNTEKIKYTEEEIKKAEEKIENIDHFTMEQAVQIQSQYVIQERTLKVLDRLEEKVYGGE